MTSLGRLAIEGQNVPVVQVDEWFETPLFSDVKTKSLRQLAESVIDRSPEYKRREEVKKEHLAVLKEGGVEAWNKWRSRNPEVRPTLYQAELSQESMGDLSDANFSYADLCEAELREAILVRANFHQANLAGADLHKAHLRDANVCRADLYGTTRRPS